MNSETEARLERVEREIADIKGTLAQMMPMLFRLADQVARAEARAGRPPRPTEFHELRGRVAALGRRPAASPSHH